MLCAKDGYAFFAMDRSVMMYQGKIAPHQTVGYIREVLTLLLIRESQDFDYRDYQYLRKQWEELARLRKHFVDEARDLGRLDTMIRQPKRFRRRYGNLGKTLEAQDEKLLLSSL